MILSSPPLLQGRQYLYFLLLSFSLLFFTLSVEYYQYDKLTRFDDAVIEVTVLKHYTKERAGKRYDVLQLQSDDGAKFYITSKAVMKNLVGYRTKIWLLTAYITFPEYLKGFAAKGRVILLEREKQPRYRLGERLKAIHPDEEAAELYGALFLALPLSRSLQERLSFLGISHLLAISGFHLGVLSLVLFSLLRWPYTSLQARYFPARHRNRDLFVTVALILGVYLLFLGGVASLLRAYAMLVVGYVLHDRGMKILSMQTLFITLVLLLAIWPRLFFSIGFWLSIGGVYFIFLYLRYFGGFSKYISLVSVPLWVYLMMTPVALLLFGNYSPYHALSVVWSILFSLFYPIALLLHLAGYGEGLDSLLLWLLSGDVHGRHFSVPIYWLAPYILLALGAIYSRAVLYILLLVALGVSVTAVYQIAQT